MEIGGFFILLIVLAVLAVLAGAVLAIGSTLRKRKLDPRGDRVEGSDSAGSESSARPEHVRVRGEQRTRFLTDR